MSCADDEEEEEEKERAPGGWLLETRTQHWSDVGKERSFMIWLPPNVVEVPNVRIHTTVDTHRPQVAEYNRPLLTSAKKSRHGIVNVFERSRHPPLQKLNPGRQNADPNVI